MELIIGPRLYSTWSLRPWLVLKRCKADFTVREIDIYSPEGRAELEQVSPSRLVPLLIVDGVTVWDSMAISVWCAERYPEIRLWPADPHARWLARAAACEMHGGFMGLRTECGMGPDHTIVGPDRSPAPTGEAVDRDIRRIISLWKEMRGRGLRVREAEVKLLPWFSLLTALQIVSSSVFRCAGWWGVAGRALSRYNS